MKYIPLKNQPNASRTRFESSSPSMQLDSRGYPHIVWLEEKSGKNEISYTFWDGLKWSYLGTSIVFESEEDVNPSPNTLILDNQDNPVIVFSSRLGTGAKLSLSTYSDGWSHNNLNVTYDVGWIGITEKKEDAESSSSSSMDSSSSSSETVGERGNYYVVTYDITNSQFHIYAVGTIWALIGSISASTDYYLTTKISMCDTKIAIVFTEDSTTIEFNFFDIVTDSWSSAAFWELNASTLYGEITDVDLEGYDTSGVERFSLGWLSKTDDYSYVNSVMAYSDGTVTPSDLANTNVEVNVVDIIPSSTAYLVNGYKKIGVTLDDNGLCQIVCLGVSSKIFSLSALNVWSSDLIDLEVSGNGMVYTYLDINYSEDIKISFGSDSGDVYYVEPTTSETFPIANPNMAVLSQGDFAYKATNFIPPEGEDISDLVNNYYGCVLSDAKRRLLISPNVIIDSSSSSSSSSSL